MPRFILHLLQLLQGFARWRRARRRRVNLRAGATQAGAGRHAGLRLGTLPWRLPAWRPSGWLVPAGVLCALAGALLIAGHARHLAAALPDAPGPARAAQVYQAVLPGAAFQVPAGPGLMVTAQQGGALLVAAGMRAARPIRIDLCSQLADPASMRLAPLRLGYRFDDVRRWAAHNDGSANPLVLRNVLLLADSRPGAVAAMPEVRIGGTATADFSQPLQLSWNGAARWIGDASLGQVTQAAGAEVALLRQGWLWWDGPAALRIERRASAACPQAGELVLQLYQPLSGETAGAPPKALVTAFPLHGQPVAAYLAPGDYQVPGAPRASLEDQALFLQLQAHGLLRLNGTGMAELAPRDLPLWQAAPLDARAAELAAWRDVKLDAASAKLLKQLYQQADGAYVRQQIAIFNGELRLLAWRTKSVDGAGGAPAPWQAQAGAAPLPLTQQMPLAASRLFADLPHGWAEWHRVARWPQPGDAGPGQLALTLALPRPASGAERYELMLIGRVRAIDGARLLATPACGGRACPAPDAVQRLTLTPLAGARAIRLDVDALDASTLGGRQDRQYRHLNLVAGKLVWQPLDQPDRTAGAAARAPSPVLLHDRSGTLLWADGRPTEAARAAGLAPLLGLNLEHGSSVAGMLARLPRPGSARLSLDLALQTLSQQVLDCVGMRRGRWDGSHCNGAQPVPDGRRAGLVFLDADNGDVLAAAGSMGGGAADRADWREVRDFDRVNPARSPLRLPALQHDGGAHQSPGSTFKVVSALGLEMAARGDPQLDALLGGMPLDAINGLARRRGFGFDTAAATYPLARDTTAGSAQGAAHITNYKEQGLDRRAQQGRLGLAQALTYSLNTWFAWTGELSDRSLFGRPDGGAPDLQPLDPDALDAVRPIVAAAHRLGFEQALRLDGGLLPPDFNWGAWDALQATPAHIDTIHTRHELRQMSIGLRMQATPLQMALAAGAIGQGRVVAPRLLLELDGNASKAVALPALDVRLDRIRAGMKGVVDAGTGAGAFGAPALAPLRRGLYGKTGTAPTSVVLPDGSKRDCATVWFTGWLEPGSMPGQTHRIAVAAFVSHSDGSGGEHAAPVVAAVLAQLVQQGTVQNREQKAK